MDSVSFFVCAFQGVCLFTANSNGTAINILDGFASHNLGKWQNQSQMNEVVPKC